MRDRPVDGIPRAGAGARCDDGFAARDGGADAMATRMLMQSWVFLEIMTAS